MDAQTLWGQGLAWKHKGASLKAPGPCCIMWKNKSPARRCTPQTPLPGRRSTPLSSSAPARQAPRQAEPRSPSKLSWSSSQSSTLPPHAADISVTFRQCLRAARHSASISFRRPPRAGRAVRLLQGATLPGGRHGAFGETEQAVAAPLAPARIRGDQRASRKARGGESGSGEEPGGIGDQGRVRRRGSNIRVAVLSCRSCQQAVGDDPSALSGQ